ncbi:FHA domain-containing protein [Aggregatilineales bacterium SYSU G02658]
MTPTIDLEQLRWTVPVALGVVLLIQLLYLAVLSRIPRQREAVQPPPVLPSVQPYTPASAPSVPTTSPQPMSAPPVPSAAPPAPVMPSASSSTMPAPAPAAPLPSAAAAPAVAGGPRGKFVVLAGIEGVSEIAIPAKEFTIGRFYNPENDILIGLDERSISRKHARFIVDESTREYYIKDTASSFGTFLLINGQFEQLAANVQERVYNEDVVRFGNVVTVRLILPIETRGTVTSL